MARRIIENEVLDDDETSRSSGNEQRGRGFRSSRSENSTEPRERVRRARAEPTEENPNRKSALQNASMASYKKRLQETSLKFRRLEIEELKTTVIHFLEPEPFAHIYRHWVYVDGKRRPYVCIGGEDCPLCAVGDRAKPVIMFNVYDLSDDQVKVWECSKDPAKKVEKRFDALKDAGLTLNSSKVYFAVSKEKQDNKIVAYDVQRVTQDELVEEYRMEPLQEDELEALSKKLYDDSIVYVNTLQELQDVVDKYQD